MRDFLLPSPSPRFRRSGSLLAVLAAFGLLLTGCSDLLRPAPPAPASLALSLSLAADAGTAAAYRQANQVRVRLSRPGAQDSVRQLAYPPPGNEVRLSVELTQAQETAQLVVELLRDNDLLFRADTSVVLRARETTEAPVTLHAVPARVRVEAPASAIQSLGETLQLSGAVLFATGEPIPGLAPSYQALDAGVVEVSPAGAVVSRGEGEARVEGRYGDLADTVRVQVRAVVASVEVEPATAELQVGETLQLNAVLRDARGNALSTRDAEGNLISGRAVSWSSSRLTVAQVDEQSGAVSAAAPDTVTVTATTSEGRSGSATLSIRPLPPGVTDCGVDQVRARDALLSCVIHPQQALTEVRFEWGTSTELGSSTAVRTLSGSTPQGIFEVLEGLSPNTTYYWRVVASSAGGETASAIQSFTTAPLSTFTLTITGAGTTGSGTVTDPGGIDCTISDGVASGTCQASFTGGTQVTLTATPSTGSFSGWGGACSGTESTCAVSMNQPQSVTASFRSPFDQLALGQFHSCALTPTGRAYCWGRNVQGQLGTGNTLPSSTPVAVNTTHTFSELSAGAEHTCGLTANGQAYCWGRNAEGQLGTGNTLPSLTPVLVAGGLTFTALSAGDDNACALTDTGRAYCWGRNVEGQLGIGNTISRSRPVEVRGLTFDSLSAGPFHACARADGGEAYCWGSNIHGQLGRGDTISSFRPEPVRMPSGVASFASLSAGWFHTCALTATGRAYCWGNNAGGQLGVASSTGHSLPAEVAGNRTFAALGLGQAHTCGLTTTGEVLCWGNNFWRQLGRGNTTQSHLPEPVRMPSGVASFASLSVGLYHSCARTSDGQAYCWGQNTQGQLGDGAPTDRSLPVAVKQ